MEYFTNLFPEWDVRGVLTPQANTWIDNEHPAFLEFVDSIDIFFGLTEHGKLASRVPNSVRKIPVSPFSFFGYHPDAVWAGSVASPLDQGVFHPRIICAAYLAGRTPTDAKALYNASHFERLGYFDVFESQKKSINSRFLRESGFEIRELIEEWAGNGNFMYMPSHPRNGVFFDVVTLAMRHAGLSEHIDSDKVSQTKAGIEEYLGEGIIWPVMPEIAEHLNIPEAPDYWRKSVSKSTGDKYNLDQFIAHCWKYYDAITEAQKHELVKHLGGDEGLERIATA